MKHRKYLALTLCFSILLTSIHFTFSPIVNKAEAATIATVASGSDHNVHYWVGNGYYDVWKNTAGQWTGEGKKPGDPVDLFRYSLDITISGRKIINITAERFDVSMQDGELTGAEIYRQSRYGQNYTDIERYVTDRTFTVDLSSISGYGTDSVSGSVSVRNGWLSTIDPEDLGEDLTISGEFADAVEAYRYYFPILYTITLEPIAPETGTAYIRHFTTDGQSLDGIFDDRDETLVHGQEYDYRNPTNADYTYIGYKKKQDEPPPAGPTWVSGEGPGAFTYDSSQFSRYYVYFYYEPAAAPPPDKEYDALEIQPDPWTMYVDETRSYTAKARVKGTTTWEPISSSLIGWSTVSSAIATINAVGVAEGQSAGTTTVRGTWNALSDTATLNVLAKTTPDPEPEPEPEIEYMLDVDPDSRAIAIGDSADFDGRYKERQVGTAEWSLWKYVPDSEATWTIEDPRIASVDWRGDVTGIEGGNTRVVIEWKGLTAKGGVQVVPPNPIPVITGPDVVKENRPLPSPFSSAESYSPVSGRTIDHTRDEWTNKRDRYTTPGTVTLELHVYDNTGLKSLRPDSHTLTVLPDEPPVAKGEIVPLGLRNNTYTLYNRSYSIDGDIIRSVEYKVRYDSNNNGFSDDPWQVLTGDLTKATYRPTKVGKYQFYIKATEDYGKSDDTLSEPTGLILDVINLAPEVSFAIEGRNPETDLNPITPFSPSSIFNNWTLYETTSPRVISSKGQKWSVSSNNLVGGLGRKPERQFYFRDSDESYGPWMFGLSDNGYGNNGLNPYRAIKLENTEYSGPLLVPNGAGGWKYVSFNNYAQPNYYTTRSHLYFQFEGNYYAFNKSKVSRYDMDYVERKHIYLDGSPYDRIWQEDNTDNIPTYYVKKQYRHENTWEFYSQAEKDALGSNVSITRVDINPNTRVFKAGINTLYHVVELSCRECDEDYNVSKWDDYSFKVLHAYDLKTGVYINSSLAYDDYISGVDNVFVKGDNLVIVSSSYSAELGEHWVFEEFDRNAKVVSTKIVPMLGNVNITINYEEETINTSPDQFFEGQNGDLYIYEFGHSSNYSNRGITYLTKINSDYTLAWRVKLKGNKIRSKDEPEGKPVIAENPLKKEVLVRTYDWDGWGDSANYVERINMTTGATTLADRATYDFDSMRSSFLVDWNGNYQAPKSGQFTPDGLWTNRSTVYRQDGSVYSQFDPGGVVSIGSSIATMADRERFGTYIGDGLYLSFHNRVTGADEPSSYTLIPWISYGEPSDLPAIAKPFSLGQFLSGFSVSDVEINFSMSLDDADGDRDMAGIAFRAADSINKYTVETDGATLYLSKYVNGARTVLRQSNYPFQDKTSENIMIRALGSKIDVFVGGVPYFSVSDSQYGSGKIGPFSDKSFVRFGMVTTKAISPASVHWDQSYALWEEGSARAEVRYSNITYSDLENDPISGSYQWRYSHTPKFINNQGYSALHGQTYSSNQVYFDKVGVYDVTLSALDDPHPNYRYPSNVFAGYRKPSNEFTKRIIVHRKPVAQLTTYLKADNTVGYNDSSYDPDRWANAWTYSAPEDGKNYQTTRGVFDRKYYYVTPSGSYVEAQLIRPSEYGTYQIGLAVMDEYGAWSNWAVSSITVTNPFPPNNIPVASMIYPNGTQAVPTMETSMRPLLRWQQTDADPGTVFRGFQLQITNESNTAYILDSGELGQSTSSTAASWTPTSNLPTGQKMRVRVRVNDGADWSAWSAQTWLFINNAPTATITYPTGSQAQPTIVETKRPAITWTQTDPDPGTVFQYYEVEIINEANTWTVASSGQVWQNTSAASNSWTPNTDLPAGQKLKVRVRVYDWFVWSNWSDYRWLMVNRPPVADFTWTPNPAWEGDTIVLTNTSSDPDGDALTYMWTVSGPGGYAKTFTTKDASIAGADTRNRPGSWTVSLTVTDPHSAADTEVKTIVVGDLSITGQVLHTPEWENYRQAWNAKFPNKARSPDTFWAGEAFELRAAVTDTSTSATKPKQVTATLTATGDTVNMSSGNQVNYTAQMVNTDFSKTLSDGNYTMRFTVTWNNGHVERHDVPFKIAGDTNDVIVTQLRN
ncbi:PKD domain-containing protein [Paenibacillus alkalitolerans]|uniref:PKD domain-containing protein n=1 Tax=Paenibacillus alkalitolerans TaxID=2799335 RepID=UPI0018F53AB6|nr:PKD domain-containing protein [Paenibacillus alkalitolerans]